MGIDNVSRGSNYKIVCPHQNVYLASILTSVVDFVDSLLFFIFNSSSFEILNVVYTQCVHEIFPHMNKTLLVIQQPSKPLVVHILGLLILLLVFMYSIA